MQKTKTNNSLLFFYFMMGVVAISALLGAFVLTESFSYLRDSKMCEIELTGNSDININAMYGNGLFNSLKITGAKIKMPCESYAIRSLTGSGY